MRSSRGSSSDDAPSWRSRKAWERDFWSRLDVLRAGSFLVDDRVKRAESSSGALTFRGRLYFDYDDAHSRPGHPDHLHKHVFDPPGAPDPGTVVWIGRDNWPTLFDVVRELQEWWEETGCRLPLRSG